MFKMNLTDFTHDENFPFFIQYGEHEGSLFMHSHDNFSELVIVTEGSAEHIVDNESYHISKGDVFVISNETEHGFAKAKNFHLCNIMFRPSFWLNSDYDIAKTAGFQALFVLEPQYSKQSHFCSRLKLGVNEYVKISEICADMHSEYKEKRNGWQTLFISEFLRVASELSRLYSFDDLNSNDTMINLAKAIAFIETNYANDLTVTQLAALSNYSERQFIRLFKTAYGCNPTAYIRRLRIRHACRLLKSSDIPITEIALKCGYSDSNYFSRVFMQEMGTTPSKYRKSESIIGFEL